jgi:hypothetical protein
VDGVAYVSVEAAAHQGVPGRGPGGFQPD